VGQVIECLLSKGEALSSKRHYCQQTNKWKQTKIHPMWHMEMGGMDTGSKDDYKTSHQVSFGQQVLGLRM
jgi:hypothetical protein